MITNASFSSPTFSNGFAFLDLPSFDQMSLGGNGIWLAFTATKKVRERERKREEGALESKDFKYFFFWGKDWEGFCGERLFVLGKTCPSQGYTHL